METVIFHGGPWLYFCEGCLLKFYFHEKIIGQFVQENTLSEWLSLFHPSYDFNSYSIGHWGKIIAFSSRQSVMSTSSIPAQRLVSVALGDMAPWHKYIVKAAGSLVHGLFTAEGKFPEMLGFALRLFLCCFLNYIEYLNSESVREWLHGIWA